MRTRCTILALSIFYYSCTYTRHNEEDSRKITGQWKTEKCLPDVIHAFIRFQLADTSEIPKYRISPDFSIDLNQDGSFSVDNMNCTTKTGEYIVFVSSLVLTLKNDSISWITFGIDSVMNNSLFLSSKSIQFYSITADTLTLYTGDNVEFIMKRR